MFVSPPCSAQQWCLQLQFWLRHSSHRPQHACSWMSAPPPTAAGPPRINPYLRETHTDWVSESNQWLSTSNFKLQPTKNYYSTFKQYYWILVHSTQRFLYPLGTGSQVWWQVGWAHCNCQHPPLCPNRWSHLHRYCCWMSSSFLPAQKHKSRTKSNKHQQVLLIQDWKWWN